jgi:ABC-type hemin transport system, periplasmic component
MVDQERRPCIVSLIASATEIVCALGYRHALVGRSHECDYPPEVVRLPLPHPPEHCHGLDKPRD